MAYQKPKVVFGTGGVGWMSKETLSDMLSTLEDYRVKELDTAAIYVLFPRIISQHIHLTDFLLAIKWGFSREGWCPEEIYNLNEGACFGTRSRG